MPRYKALFLIGVCALVVSLFSASRAQTQDDADSQARIVRISHVQGEVRIDSGHGYESATMNVPVTEGNWLETGSDSWAEVQLEDGSTIRLAPETQIVFSQLARFSSGGTATTVDLDQGEAEFKIAKRDDSEFQVTVKTKTIVLDASGRFRVTSTNSDPLEIAVSKGSVAVKDPDSGGEVAVLKNETFLLDAQDVGRYALDKGVETDELDQWSKQRDDYLSAYASTRSGYTQSPYQYGVNDLDRYGQYTDVPGYGYVWQPSGVSLDWDPFENGYWSYSSAFGNYWVSAYPWGWMPFRYGNWIFVNGRGWCWQPGGWNRWHRSPRLVNAPRGFHPPAPPSRIIGWRKDGGPEVAPGKGGAGIIHRRDGGPDPAPRNGGMGVVRRDGGPEVAPGNGGAGIVHKRDGGPEVAPGNGGTRIIRRDGGPEVAPGNGGAGIVHQRDGGPVVAPGNGGMGIVRREGGPEIAPQNQNDQQGGAGRGRRVFSNDDVQSRVPPAIAPPEPVPVQAAPGVVPMERRPRVIERGNGVIRNQGGADVPVQTAVPPSPAVTRQVETQVDRTRHAAPQVERSAPVPSQPLRQYTPPVQHSAPPSSPAVQPSAPVRQFTPPPAPQPRPAPPAAAPKQTDTESRGRQR